MNRSVKNNIKTTLEVLARMTPARLAENPMMFMVWVAALMATGICLKEIYLENPDTILYMQMTFWLWMTVYFSSLADVRAESMLPVDFSQKAKELKTNLVKKIIDKDDLQKYKLVSQENITSGNLIYLQSGDEVPYDGEVIAGKSYVYESDLTGEIGDVLKSPRGDNILIAGSDLSGENDWLVMKVSFAKNKSFFAKAMNRLKNIRRYSMPSELALKRIILGLSILFIAVIFAVAVIADYSGVHIPIIYLLDLMVILLPTTISGLQHSIIAFSRARLAKMDIWVQDDVALDNAVDIHVVLLDKTGTLTVGTREMTEFTLLDKTYEDEYLQYLLHSSFDDHTYEGKSIVTYAKRRLKAEDETRPDNYEFYPFSSDNPISGCNYGDVEIRKGSVTAICRYLGIRISQLPENIKEVTKNIAAAHGTPVLFTLNHEIIGVVHLRDRFRKGVMKQIEQLKKEGLSIRMVTGDNKLTASYIAKKLGVDEYYADCTPEKKLSIVRDIQSQGYSVAMCGDGVNDALAMAQANIGLTFSDNGKVHKMLSGNIVANQHNIYLLHDLKNICKKMTAKRGALTVFSLFSDIAKYFVIVPALFTTAFPPLSVLNFMQFASIESVILASVMFNSIVIFALTPFVFHDSNWARSKRTLWKNIIFFGLGGIISPFVGIKLLEVIITYVGIL